MDKTLETELAQIRPKVLATALRFFRASYLEGDPEDVVQEVLLRLWEAWRSGTHIRNAEAWAVAAAKNCCISLWRQKRPVCSYPEDLPDSHSAATSLEEAEARQRADTALAQIPAASRRLLRLRASGLSLDEMAALTGRTKGSVKSSISAARHEMIKALWTEKN
ncbi:MAG: sigma-70 family RNA polymerase sigma factor [Bacteroidales bacterium]|nr:sigma-70 family RNA polymerase sigma factor [Bacteroidales bacterium]